MGGEQVKAAFFLDNEKTIMDELEFRISRDNGFRADKRSMHGDFYDEEIFISGKKGFASVPNMLPVEVNLGLDAHIKGIIASPGYIGLQGGTVHLTVPDPKKYGINVIMHVDDGNLFFNNRYIEHDMYDDEGLLKPYIFSTSDSFITYHDLNKNTMEEVLSLKEVELKKTRDSFKIRNACDFMEFERNQVAALNDLLYIYVRNGAILINTINLPELKKPDYTDILPPALQAVRYKREMMDANREGFENYEQAAIYRDKLNEVLKVL